MLKALSLALSLIGIQLICPLSATAAAHHKGTLSSINLGVRYSSVLQNRGVLFYPDFQIDPILAVFLFDDRLEYLGDSIGYRDFIYKDILRLRSRLVSVSDNPLFPDRESVKNNYPDRPDTYEWNTRLEIFLPGYNENYIAEIDFGYSKDLYRHKGDYFEIQSKIKLFDFKVPQLNTKIEPQFFTSVGWGNNKHNQYFYGPSASSDSFNNLSYGLWFSFPEEADRFYPIIQISRFQVLGNDNRSAAYANNRSDGWLVSFIATVGLFDLF